MGMFPRLNFRGIFGVFRKPAIAASQRRVVRWTVAAAVPISVFGASSLYGRHTAAPAVEDLHETFVKSLREPSSAQVLKSHLGDRLFKRLITFEDSSADAADFYEDILKEVILNEQTNEIWCFHEMLHMRYRLEVLQAYLQLFGELYDMPDDFHQKYTKDIVKKIEKTKQAIKGHLVLRDCGVW